MPNAYYHLSFPSTTPTGKIQNSNRACYATSLAFDGSHFALLSMCSYALTLHMMQMHTHKKQKEKSTHIQSKPLAIHS